MTHVARKDASNQLDTLLEQAAKGEEVIIEREDGSRFHLVLVEQPAQNTPKFGSAKGQVKLSDDFDAPLDDFAEYM